MINKAHKYRIYPTKEQEEKLAQTFGCVRFVWNQMVANFNSYDKDVEPVIVNEKTLKDNPEYSFLNNVSAAALQQKRIDFDSTKKQFFNKKRKVKLGRMKFKKRGVSNDSYRLDAKRFTLDYENNLIRIEKIGKVRIVIDRSIPDDAKINSITVSRTKTGKYFVSIQFECAHVQFELTGKKVGLDLGLTHFLITSNGDKVDNPKLFRKNQAKLAKAQRHLCRKKRGSNRYKLQKLKVARIHEKIRNSREHIQHEITNKLAREYDVICIENLNVKGMVKNRKLSKSISDASWASFVSKLEYKMNWNQKILVKIDRFYQSSKTCSDCGDVIDSLSLDVREWACPSCGCIHDRDINAAKNILIKGYSDLTGISIEESSAELVDYRRGEDVRHCASDAVFCETSRQFYQF